MSEEFENRKDKSEESVDKVIDYLKGIGIYASKTTRSNLSKEVNDTLSKQGTPLALLLRFFPDIIGCVGNKIFVAEVKNREPENSGTGNFAFNEDARKNQVIIQAMLQTPVLVICEDLPLVIGGQFLDKLSVGELKKGNYRLIKEKDLLNLAPLLWHTYLQSK